MPLRSGIADLLCYHHGIDDIYETEGMGGLLNSLRESVRVLRTNGLLIFSHCEFISDPFSREISLKDVEKLLQFTKNKLRKLEDPL